MKYYKITNESENHNGMQYKTGLNVDILDFNPGGDCTSGGIYFASKDILAFLSYGVWIREVTIPEDEEVYENPNIPKKYKAHRVILGERRRIDVSVIKDLVEQGANVHANDDCALRWATENGHLEVVKYLVEQGADVHADDDCALRWAASSGHLKVVEYLVEQGADIHAEDDEALRWAANNGHFGVVEFLKSCTEN